MTTRYTQKQNLVKLILAGTILVSSFACGSASSTSGISDADDSSSNSSVASAAGALFGGSSSQSSNLTVPSALLQEAIRHAEEESEEDGNETCNTIEDESGPSGIVMGYNGAEGSYGAEDYAMDVLEEDFCRDSDNNENTGTGPDGVGLFGTFEMEEDVIGNCEDADGNAFTIDMLAGSSGIWRNTGDYQPEIYGTFVVEDESGNQTTIDCTIFLDEDENIVQASCSDENGVEVEQESETECSFSSEE
ncbi:MAG: hypothetical protein H7A33_07460 [Deltaproteobacteria bacterium]|nr:hypothetical protein [Deltaproteobacteria bacterium]